MTVNKLVVNVLKLFKRNRIEIIESKNKLFGRVTDSRGQDDKTLAPETRNR